jgi:hypothetical protein
MRYHGGGVGHLDPRTCCASSNGRFQAESNANSDSESDSAAPGSEDERSGDDTGRSGDSGDDSGQDSRADDDLISGDDFAAGEFDVGYDM